MRENQQYAATWLTSFKQTYEACMNIAQRTRSNRRSNTVGTNFKSSPFVKQAEAGAGAGLKSALLITDELSQYRILGEIEGLVSGFGLDPLRVLAEAAKEASTRVGQAFAEAVDRIRRMGTEIKGKYAKPVIRACAIAALTSAFLAGGAAHAEEEGGKLLARMIDGQRPVAEQTLNRMARDEAVEKLRREVYSLFDYVERNYFLDKKPLSKEERNAFVRPLTVMLALQGEEETALVVQLLADPQDEGIFDWCESRGVNPFELVQRVADIAGSDSESVYKNLAVQSARYMYGEDNAGVIFERTLEQMEEVLNTERGSSPSYAQAAPAGARDFSIRPAAGIMRGCSR